MPSDGADTMLASERVGRKMPGTPAP